MKCWSYNQWDTFCSKVANRVNCKLLSPWLKSHLTRWPGKLLSLIPAIRDNSIYLKDCREEDTKIICQVLRTLKIVYNCYVLLVCSANLLTFYKRIELLTVYDPKWVEYATQMWLLWMLKWWRCLCHIVEHGWGHSPNQIQAKYT